MARNLQNFVEWGRKIVAVGRNYRDHCAELGNPVPTTPLIFMKPPSSYLKEDSGPISIPRGCSNMHYEVELAVVISKEICDAKENEIEQAIGGYALALDMTARDFQEIAKKKGNPWAMAKCFDTSTPISRFVAKEELPNPGSVKLWCKVNDKIQQDGTTSDMVFNIPYLISYISGYFTLHPGDVVLTGTPAGVGPVFAGDKLSCGLGNILEMKFDVIDKA